MDFLIFRGNVFSLAIFFKQIYWTDNHNSWILCQSGSMMPNRYHKSSFPRGKLDDTLEKWKQQRIYLVFALHDIETVVLSFLEIPRFSLWERHYTSLLQQKYIMELTIILFPNIAFLLSIIPFLFFLFLTNLWSNLNTTISKMFTVIA